MYYTIDSGTASQATPRGRHRANCELEEQAGWQADQAAGGRRPRSLIYRLAAGGRHWRHWSLTGSLIDWRAGGLAGWRPRRAGNSDSDLVTAADADGLSKEQAAGWNGAYSALVVLNIIWSDCLHRDVLCGASRPMIVRLSWRRRAWPMPMLSCRRRCRLSDEHAGGRVRPSGRAGPACPVTEW
jgi:hypothetical protein